MKKVFETRNLVRWGVILLLAAPLLHQLWQLTEQKTLCFEWDLLIGGNGQTELLVTQFSLTFIVSSLITMLSSRDEKILWCNLIEQKLILPAGRSLKDLVLYLFFCLLFSTVSIVCQLSDMLLIYFGICILLLVIVSEKMLRVYFGKERTLTSLKNEFQKEGLDIQEEKLDTLFDNTVSLIDAGESNQVVENAEFLLEVIREKNSVSQIAEDTLLGVFQVMAERDIVLFHRVYRRLGSVESELREPYCEAFKVLLSAVYQKARKMQMSYIYLNMPNYYDLDQIYGESLSVQKQIIQKEIENARKAFVGIYEKLIQRVEMDKTFVDSLQMQYDSSFEDSMFSFHIDGRTALKEIADLFLKEFTDENTRFLKEIVDEMNQNSVRLQKLYDNLFEGEATENSHPQFMVYYQEIMNGLERNSRSYREMGERLTNSTKNVKNQNHRMFLIWLMNNLVEANGYTQLWNSSYIFKRNAYEGIKKAANTDKDGRKLTRNNMFIPQRPCMDSSTSMKKVRTGCQKNQSIYESEE